MSDLQNVLVSFYCPPLDPELVATLVKEEADTNACISILDALANNIEAGLSSKDNDDDDNNNHENARNESSAANLGLQMDSLSLGDDSSSSGNYDYFYDYGDEFLDFEELERVKFIPSEDEYGSNDASSEFLKECFPKIPAANIEILFRENDNDAEKVLSFLLDANSNSDDDDDDDDNDGIQQIRSSSSLVANTSNLSSRKNDYKHRKKKKSKKSKKKKGKNRSNSNSNSNLSSSQKPSKGSSSSSSSSSSPTSSSSLSSLSIANNYGGGSRNGNNNSIGSNSSYSRNDNSISGSSSSSISSSSNGNKTISSSSSLSDSSTNAWKKQLELQEMFPNIPSSVISSKYHENNANIHDTLDCLISLNDDNNSNSSRSSRSSSSSRRDNNNHTTTYKPNGNYNNYNGNNNSEKLDGFKVIENKTSNRHLYTSKINNNNHYNVDYDYDDDDYDDDYDDDDYDDDNVYEPSYCRKQILLYKRLRDEAFKEASIAYRKFRGKLYYNNSGGIPEYHTDEGKDYHQKMKTWELRYAWSITERTREKSGGNKLDLHGLTVDQASYVVRKQLNRLYPKSECKKHNGKALTIVTGVGKHSLNGIPKLPNAVKQILREGNWNFTENQGYVIVKGRK